MTITDQSDSISGKVETITVIRHVHKGFGYGWIYMDSKDELELLKLLLTRANMIGVSL